MKSKFFLSLLAVLTIVTFTSNASAATCPYNTNLACSVDTSPVGNIFGCMTYIDKLYNGNCIKDCATCTSGYTRQANVYRDSSGCTIDYYSCVPDGSFDTECATTEYSRVTDDFTVISNHPTSCRSATSGLRCTSSKECVSDCESCGSGYKLATRKVQASTGCKMTYQECVAELCLRDSDCGISSGWVDDGRIGVQSSTTYTCNNGMCGASISYRCQAGYAGIVTAIKNTCSKCELGYYAAAGAVSCTACSDGSYTNALSGATSCLSCATQTGNEYATSVAPAAGIESCFVPAGTFTVGDETGNKGFVEDCYYEGDDSGIVVKPGNSEIGGIVTPL